VKSTVRALSALGEDVVLAPERFLSVDDTGQGIPLGELVLERRERSISPNALVLDTTHARDGLLDIPAALRASGAAASAKKLALAGDLIISRLRPYLRQIALVHPRAIDAAGGRPLALSTEFYVFAPKNPGEDLAFLLPYLLGERVQAILAASQEGGHHPRVPRTSVLALRIPEAIVRARLKLARETTSLLDALYDAGGNYQELLARFSSP
jgi:hypothetical protein